MHDESAGLIFEAALRWYGTGNIDMSIVMNTTINQKISPLLEPRSSLLEKTVRPRLHCSDPFVHLRLRLHLSRLRQEREKPEEHTHKART